MASTVSGQDESNPALWLATRAGKMELSCPLGTTRRVPREKISRKPHNKSFIDQACSVKMAGYWPRSFFANLWTSTPSRSINTRKKNLANIQPSWPHTWSITHTHYYQCKFKFIKYWWSCAIGLNVFGDWICPGQDWRTSKRYSPIFKTGCVKKNIWWIMNTIAFIWRQNMLGYSSLDITLSENCSLLGTDNVRGQISQHISAQNGGYCLYIIMIAIHKLSALIAASSTQACSC